MDEIQKRLTTCFRLVFPDLPEAEIPSASQETIAAWDSIATITLVSVIGEEFGIEIDLAQIGDLTSFDKLLAYLQDQKVT
jgi:acyl carrier protein